MAASPTGQNVPYYHHRDAFPSARSRYSKLRIWIAFTTLTIALYALISTSGGIARGSDRENFAHARLARRLFDRSGGRHPGGILGPPGHAHGLLKKKHAEHHRDGDGQGWFWEFVDYAVGVIPHSAAGFLVFLRGRHRLCRRRHRLRRVRRLFAPTAARAARALFLDGASLPCGSPRAAHVEEQLRHLAGHLGSRLRHVQKSRLVAASAPAR